MKRRIGAITIGQSPRVDIIDDICPLLPESLEIIQKGVLDGMISQELEAIAPSGTSDADGPILVSRLSNGKSVVMGEKKILPIIQNLIYSLEKEDVSLILMLCTGTFPNTLKSKVPILYPQKVLYNIVPLIAKRIGVVSPSPKQITETKKRWGKIVSSVDAKASNPYEGGPNLEEIGKAFSNKDIDICVLDCIGYTQKMKQRLETASGKPVILPRTLIARLLSELFE